MTVFMTVLLLGGIPPMPRLVFQTGKNEKHWHCMHVMTGGTSPRTTVGPPTGMNEFEKNWRLECSAYREDRRSSAGLNLNASGSEAQWFLPAPQIPSFQTKPLIGNYLPARRSDQRIQNTGPLLHESLKNYTTHLY
jgi:hypothetical protein